MRQRKKLTRSKSRKNFRRGTKVHKKNGIGRPQRGGIRL